MSVSRAATKLVLLASLCVAAEPAWADAAADLRERVGQARQRSESLQRRQADLEKALSELGQRIEAMKAARSGKLLRNDELDQALKRSQELAAELAEVQKTQGSLSTTLWREEAALIEALNDDLAAASSKLVETKDRETRKALAAKIRALRQERDSLRGRGADPNVPPLMDGAHSDDPAELLERADALRDTQDKVRARLASVEGRIAEVRAERELDRRVGELMEDEALFDETDRRLQMRRTIALGAPSRPGGGDAPSAEKPDSFAASAPNPEGGPTATTAPPPTQAPNVGGNRTTSASDSRPEVGAVPHPAVAGGDEGDMEDLVAQRQRLLKLAEELERKAKALERRARELR